MAMIDVGASVLSRLKNKSKETGKPFQLHLQLFCQEEFLRRVSLSKYAHNLILKGGMLIYMLSNFESRATVDIDFLLLRLPCALEDIRKIIDEILAIDTGNNYIVLSSDGFRTTFPQQKYEGISFQLTGQIKNTRTSFNVDLSIGDVIIPGAQMRQVQVQLEEFIIPVIMSYSLESTIAEKLDALLQRLELTSRMKDFYDIYYLSSAFDFDGRQLQRALYETLTNRGTPFERNSLSRVIALGGDKDIQVRWRQYLRRTKLPEVTITQVLSCIDVFLRPVWNAIMNEDELHEAWCAHKNEWL